MRRASYLLGLIATACGPGPTLLPRLQDHPNVARLEPGSRYEITVAAATDDRAVGTLWTGDALQGSPLAFMERTPLVIKADDFGGPLNEPAVAFVEELDRVTAVAGLGMITREVEKLTEARLVYTPIRNQGFELWFHGHTHEVEKLPAEFDGTGLASQVDTLARGLRIGRELLDVQFRSFGAPGNRFDGDTATALAEFPEVVVWLFGAADAPVFVLPRLVDLELEPGIVRDPREVPTMIDEALAPGLPPAVTLQVHPSWFTKENSQRFADVVRILADDDRLRWETPLEVWTWHEDRAHIQLIKTSATTYLLDLSLAAFDHRLAFPKDSSATVSPLP
jgi:hypothetical protein